MSDFYMSILYPITLLNCFIKSNVFVKSSGVFTYKIRLSKYRGAISFFFQFGCLYFSFLTSCSAYNFQFYVNRSDESGHPCTTFDLWGKAFGLSPLLCQLQVFHISAFIMFFREFFSVPNLSVFMKGFQILSSDSSSSVEMIMQFSNTLILLITLFNFCMLNLLYIIEINPTFSDAARFFN